MICNECIKSDVCNQKEVLKELSKELENITVNKGEGENTYRSFTVKELWVKYGIGVNIECNLFIDKNKFKGGENKQ